MTSTRRYKSCGGTANNEEGCMKAGEIFKMFNDCHRCYSVLREWLKDSAGTVPSTQS